MWASFFFFLVLVPSVTYVETSQPSAFFLAGSDGSVCSTDADSGIGSVGGETGTEVDGGTGVASRTGG